MNTFLKTKTQRRRWSAFLLVAVIIAMSAWFYRNFGPPAHVDIRRYPPFQDARFGMVYLVSYMGKSRASKERVWEMHTMDGKLVDDSTFFAEKHAEHSEFRFPFTSVPTGHTRQFHIFRAAGKLHILCEEKDAAGKISARTEMISTITHPARGVLDKAKQYFLDRKNERLLSEGKEISDTGT